MSADHVDFKHTGITEKIIMCSYEVHNTLGFGFVEKVYENALAIELRALGLAVKQSEPINVFYKGSLVGEYVADLIVEDKVIVELKAVKNLDSSHEVQLVNYLKATGIEVGLLLNFGRSVDVVRKVMTRTRPNPRNWKKADTETQEQEKKN